MRRTLEEVSGALLILAGTFLFLLVTWMGLKFLGGLFPDQDTPAQDTPASKHERAHAQAAGTAQRDVRPGEQPAIRDSGAAQDEERRPLPAR